jgi:hypothetical protein
MYYVTASDVHGVQWNDNFHRLLLLEEVSTQPLHIAPRHGLDTGVVDFFVVPFHPIQLRDSVVRGWPHKHLRAIASGVHHEIGAVTYWRTGTTKYYLIVTMRGMRSAARLATKQATSAFRKAAVPNINIMTNDRY